MLKNYWKVAVRNLFKVKGYTLINITGLTVGITCFILIMLYVKYEMSYDSFHENNDRIYRVAINLPSWNFRGSTDFALASGILAPTLMDEYREVQRATRFTTVDGLIAYGDKRFIHQGIVADEYFLDVFTFALIEGKKDEVLEEPLSMVITEKLANKLFGDEDPMGDVIRFRDQFDFSVTGIMKDVPGNSHIDFDYIISISSSPALGRTNLHQWGLIDYGNYVLLEEGVSISDFEQKLPDFVERHHSFSSEETKPRYILQSLRDIYLKSDLNFEILSSGDQKVITIFTLIAVTILLIACINYINLATARSEGRQKEIGIRKTVGANRAQLIGQFLGESVVIVGLAMLLSIAIIAIILPRFSLTLKMDMGANVFNDWILSWELVTVFLIVGVLSGLYPAFVMSSFQPGHAMKKRMAVYRRVRSLNLRNTFVMFQFIITVLLIIATVVVQRQVHFIMNRDSGYDKENIVVVNTPKELRHQYLAIKEDLLKHPQVVGVTFSNTTPIVYSEANSARIESDGQGDMMTVPQVGCFFVDYDFFEIYDLRILKGRTFSRDFSTDGTSAVIINESTAVHAGLADAIGKKFSRSDVPDGRIIGVFNDFNQVSFKQKIEPVMFLLRPEKARQFSVKIAPDNIQATLSYIEDTFSHYSETFVFEYEFFDDAYNEMFRAEKNYGTVLFVFSSIAISIASLGLVGMISYIAEKSKKEIGIRKTLGASVWHCVFYLTRNFVILVLISNVVAWPIGYTLMRSWLKEFAYRVEFHPFIFVLTGLLTFLFTVFTVSYQSINAALANPVDSLRGE